MATEDEQTLWVLDESDAFIARKVFGRNLGLEEEKGKENQEAGRPI